MAKQLARLQLELTTLVANKPTRPRQVMGGRMEYQEEYQRDLAAYQQFVEAFPEQMDDLVQRIKALIDQL